MPSEIVKECSKRIKKKGFKIAFLESATAGRMCAEFSLCEESGKILRGGLSCYEVFVKEKILKVPELLIEKYTPESAEVTECLVKNGASFFNTEITVAITGLTTPGGSETPEKPVGTMFVAIRIHDSTYVCREVFKGSPEQIVLNTIDFAAGMLLKKLDRK